MKKLIVLGLLITLLAILGGCFEENEEKDSASGVKMKRVGNSIILIAQDEIAGIDLSLDRIIAVENVKITNDELKIVKHLDGKSTVSIAKISGNFNVGEEIATLEGIDKKIRVETTDKASISHMESVKSSRDAQEKLLGDFNNNGKVNVDDFIMFARNYGNPVYMIMYDIGPASLGTSVGWEKIYAKPISDGKIDIYDFIVFAHNYGAVIPSQPPTVSITSPATGAVTGTITISATASDDKGVTKVIFYVGKNNIGELTSSPYSINWDSKKLSNGLYELKAEAYDTDNNVTTSTAISITVNNIVEIGNNHPSTGSYSVVDQQLWATAKYSLGSTIVGNDATFAVYSKNATRMLLEIYDAKIGVDAKYDYWMTKGADNIWRAKLSGIPANTLYGYRAWGPNWIFDSGWKRGNSSAGFISDVDTLGNRFNPNKMLYDPYARELSHDKEGTDVFAAGQDGGIYGTGDGLYKNVTRRLVDSGKYATKSVIVNDQTSFGSKPKIAQKDSIIYEAHVSGLTKHDSSAKLKDILAGISGFENIENVPDIYRGTYKGAGYMAKYLKALGVNTIELLPVQETINDNNSDSSPAGNYWGYMTSGFFAPDRRYSYDKSLGGVTKEFKEMVKAFHDAGIEVYMDVVYNHTSESAWWDATGNTCEVTSFRGLDNSEYYQLIKVVGKESSGLIGYQDNTGCSNNFLANHTPGKNLIIDSLTYWIDNMGIDGFRFDLAPEMGRCGKNPQDGGVYKDKWENGKHYEWYEAYTFWNQAPVLTAISALGSEKNAEMIAEAWDIGAYEVGNFPNGWGEWNGFYRDTMRRFVKGGTNKPNFDKPSFADVVNGTYGSFNDQGGPQKSVNFIIAHDGFTLMDLVSYNEKMNSKLSWPFGASDGGSNDNDSWDHGGNQPFRRQQMRNFWTIQMFSRGVPMVVYGDEFARTQNGNNNPYCIDSICTWNNYNMINTDSPNMVTGGYNNNYGTDLCKDSKNNLFLFTKNLFGIRNKHTALSGSLSDKKYKLNNINA